MPVFVPSQLPFFQPHLTSTHPLPLSLVRCHEQRLRTMSTPNRTETNRENAQHSTGPKTKAGKWRSSLNALRHGLTGQVVVMPNEDLAAHRSHEKSFTDEYHPKGATEAQLVQQLADTSWRLNRVVSIEANLLTLAA